MVRVFQTFAAERRLRRLLSNLKIEAATDYYPQPGDSDYRKNDDAPWVKRFADAGGKVIICNDSKMLRLPHERRALVEAGLIVVFFESSWNQLSFTGKCAHLLFWWERIVATVQHSASPAFWRIPQNWDANGKLRKLPHDDLARMRIERQMAEQPKIAADRAKRRAKEERDVPLLKWEPPDNKK